MLTPSEYGNIFSDLGYENVVAEDKTDMFVYYLKKELAEVEKDKDQFINVFLVFSQFFFKFISCFFFIFKEFSVEDYNSIIKGWNEKLVRCGQGFQKWGLFKAEKKN